MIEKLVLNMGINAMKDNFLALDDEEKQSEFCKLLDENQELKAKINGVYEERTYLYNKLSIENEQLNNLVNSCQEEIRQLKKQLEELKEEKQEWVNLLDMFKNQQKEFINYLEDEINNTTSRKEQLRNKEAILVLEIRNSNYNIILQKYKSIIGVLDENEN